jgi:hypothetical protein
MLELFVRLLELFLRHLHALVGLDRFVLEALGLRFGGEARVLLLVDDVELLLQIRLRGLRFSRASAFACESWIVKNTPPAITTASTPKIVANTSSLRRRARWT